MSWVRVVRVDFHFKSFLSLVNDEVTAERPR